MTLDTRSTRTVRLGAGSSPDGDLPRRPRLGHQRLLRHLRRADRRRPGVGSCAGAAPLARRIPCRARRAVTRSRVASASRAATTSRPGRRPLPPPTPDPRRRPGPLGPHGRRRVSRRSRPSSRRLTLELTGDRATLGRVRTGATVDVDLPLTGAATDPAVSHHQCEFERTAAGWVVRDTDSANGTWINDATEPLAPGADHTLADGDRILIGAWTCLTVHLAPYSLGVTWPSESSSSASRGPATSSSSAPGLSTPPWSPSTRTGPLSGPLDASAGSRPATTTSRASVRGAMRSTSTSAPASSSTASARRSARRRWSEPQPSASRRRRGTPPCGRPLDGGGR